MDKVIYVVATAAKQMMLAQTVNSNNLANASTAGFQADFTNFDAEYLTGDGWDTRTYSVAEDAGVSFEKGSIQTTDRSLDVAVSGDGWIAVQAPDGSEAYTRRGDLQVTINGQLLTATGYPVLGDAGPLVVPEYEKLEIGTDGTVSVRPIGQQATVLAEVGRIKLVSPDSTQLYKGDDGLLRMADGSIADASTDVSLISGALESSNVNSVEALVNMIDLARQFETAVKILQTADEMDQQSARMMILE
jgi:flagellar basal-body rod protein FlgF